MKRNWRTFISACACLLLTVVCLCVPVHAEENDVWEYRVDNNQVTITAYHGNDKKLDIPDALGGYKVTAIGENVFNGNITLESVTLPDAITTIGKNAFRDCSSLTEVTLSNALTSIGSSAFASSKLKSVVIPDSVSYLGAYAFDGCTGLRSVSLGCGITEWGSDWGTNAAFRGCTLLTDLTITEGLTSIGSYLFQGCTLLMEAEIPSTVESVYEGAFLDCELLDTVTVYGSIGNKAFKNCTSLKDITLDEVYTIGSEAFAGDTALKKILLPEMLTSIGGSAFEGCTKLQEIVIPDNVSYVGAYAYRNCTQLETAVLGSGISEWGSDWGNNEAFSGCTKLTDLTILDGCAYLPANCFRNCTALEFVEIPGSCVSVNEGAFRSCSALETVILNDGICHIYANAFNDDVVLSKADLPESLLTVDNYAFHNTRLREVRVPDKAMTIGYYAFSDNPALRTVYIGESVETWNTDWGTNGAFQNDVRLESLEIAEGCMYIGSYAFRNCSSLTEVDIPITATSVNEGAFQDCISLTRVSILRGEIGAKAFMGCTALSDLSIKRVTAIKDSAFRDCTALYELELPDTVTSIENFAFNNCISLSTLVIPESVTYLGAYSFANCTGLLTVYISNNITEWGKDWGDCRVFSDDISLQYAYVDDHANSLGNQLFRNCSSLKGVYLPESIVSYTKDLFNGCPEDLIVYGTGSKMKTLAEENGRAFSTDKFELPEFETVTLTITSGKGGVIAPMGEIEKPVGSSQAITIVPAFGYMVDTYTVDGYKYDYWDTLVDIQEPVEIEVTFTEDPDYVEEYPLLDEEEAEEEEDSEEEEPEDETPEEDSEEEPEEDAESEEDEDEEMAALLGYYDEDGDYINEFLGLRFHLEDSSWYYMDRDQLLELNGITTSMISDEELAESMRKAMEDGSSIACMQAMAPLGSPNVNLNMQKLGGIASVVDESQFLEIVALQLEQTLASIGGQNCEYEITTVMLAGNETPCIMLTWELYGIPFYQCAAVKKADIYMAMITTTSLEEGQEEQLMSYWSELD